MNTCQKNVRLPVFGSAVSTREGTFTVVAPAWYADCHTTLLPAGSRLTR